MATGFPIQMDLQEDLRKQLALVVRSIQWSYAIFWSISSTQPGVLKWVDGYYNGDIKTRKTIQATEFSHDELGLKRSDQLRELYDYLSTEDSNQQARRPSASLSPEDLTNTEWYYLVCMSFVFNLGQGLPGRTLASGQPIWLCNAQQADNKLFNRSLLAKSASIQTVACFPFSGGVVELGITEKVLEDPSFIQYVQSSFLTSTPILANALLDEILIHTDPNDIVGCEESDFCHQSGDSYMKYGLDMTASDQVQKFLIMDDDGTNDSQDSMSSSDCISQNLVGSENISSIQSAKEENEINPIIQSDDVRYQSVVSTLLNTSDKFMIRSFSRECDKGSSFTRWNKGKVVDIERVQNGTSQNLLKKVLFVGTLTQNACMLEYKEDINERKDGMYRPETNEINSNHVLAERRRREKLSERFSVLESLVPSASKVDKVSILDNTIEYIRELEKKVETISRRSPGRGEMTCDNYADSNKNDRKRKKRFIDNIKYDIIGELEVEETNEDVNVRVIEKDVSIEINCPWRECLLLEIIDEIGRLHLASHSVQSNSTNGTLSIIVQSKFKDSRVPTRRIIKQAIQRVIQKA